MRSMAVTAIVPAAARAPDCPRESASSTKTAIDDAPASGTTVLTKIDANRTDTMRRAPAGTPTAWNAWRYIAPNSPNMTSCAPTATASQPHLRSARRRPTAAGEVTWDAAYTTTTRNRAVMSHCPRAIPRLATETAERRGTATAIAGSSGVGAGATGCRDASDSGCIGLNRTGRRRCRATGPRCVPESIPLPTGSVGPIGDWTPAMCSALPVGCRDARTRPYRSRSGAVRVRRARRCPSPLDPPVRHRRNVG